MTAFAHPLFLDAIVSVPRVASNQQMTHVADDRHPVVLYREDIFISVLRNNAVDWPPRQTNSLPQLHHTTVINKGAWYSPHFSRICLKHRALAQ